jgi:hypothetical protein
MVGSGAWVKGARVAQRPPSSLPPEDPMSNLDLNSRLEAFVREGRDYWDEKGDAQVFLDHLFQALGWPGHKAAGAGLETRVRRAKVG